MKKLVMAALAAMTLATSAVAEFNPDNASDYSRGNYEKAERFLWQYGQNESAKRGLAMKNWKVQQATAWAFSQWQSNYGLAPDAFDYDFIAEAINYHALKPFNFDLNTDPYNKDFQDAAFKELEYRFLQYDKVPIGEIIERFNY